MRIRILLLSVISAIIICFSSLYSAEPLVKFYLNDGSTKHYNHSEIANLGVIVKKNNYVLRIHYDDSLIAYYPTEIIGSIKFENDFLNVYIFSYPKSFLLSSIDSLIFYIDQWQPITVGSQVWMLKNLNIDHYRNGDSIPEVIDSESWAKTTGFFCYYNNDSSNGKIFGKLYNWYEVNDPRGLAPLGWHVPTDDEWIALELNLGMPQDDADNIKWRGTDVGGKLKDTGTIYWQTPNKGATNESGFSAIPGGYRLEDGAFNYIGFGSYWWSSSENDSSIAWGRYLNFNNTAIGRLNYFEECCFSVRCVKNK